MSSFVDLEKSRKCSFLLTFVPVRVGSYLPKERMVEIDQKLKKRREKCG